MRKYWRTILLGVVVVILAGVYFVLSTDKDPTATGQVYPFSPGESLQEFTVQNAYGIFTFTKQNGSWILTSPALYRVNQQKVKIMEEFLLGLPIKRVLKDELQEYGFVDPAVKIDFTTMRNDKETLYIGNPTPSQSQVYLKDAKSGAIFVVDLGSISQFDGSLNAYRDKEIFAIDKSTITRISYYRDGKKEVTLERHSPKDWWLTYPYQAPARYIELNQMMAQMMNWSAVGYPSQVDPDIAGMGLDKPADILEVTDGSGNIQRLEFGISKDGKTYVRTGGKMDIAEMFSVDIHLDLFSPTKLLFLTPLRTTIGQVSRIDIESDQSTITFVIDHSVDPPQISLNGGQVPYDRFVSFFVKYITMNASGYDPSGQPLEQVMRLTTTYIDGTTQSVKLLGRNETTLYLEINGNADFYVTQAEITQLTDYLIAAVNARQ